MTKNPKVTKEQLEAVDEPKKITLAIKKADLKVLKLTIEGTTPYMQNKFSNKAKEAMMAKQRLGSAAGKGQKREPKDFEACYEAAKHRGLDGKLGIPASAFRAACISACRLVGFKMTLAKLSISVLADTFDAEEMTPLVHISGEPEMNTAPVRNDDDSFDVRARPLWKPGWRAQVRVQFDADQFTPEDIVNLFERVGTQVGVGEGRWDSRSSAGIGWGCFKIVSAS